MQAIAIGLSRTADSRYTGSMAHFEYNPSPSAYHVQRILGVTYRDLCVVAADHAPRLAVQGNQPRPIPGLYCAPARAGPMGGRQGLGGLVICPLRVGLNIVPCLLPH
jgi:hypothetical protein